MNLVIWVFGLLSGVVYLLAFAWESRLFSRPGVYAGVFGTRTEDVPAVRLWAFGVGFYNLALGLGVIAGLFWWSAGQVDVGRTLVIFTSATMTLGGLVLVLADRMAMSRERGQGIGGAIAAGVPPLVTLVATFMAS